VASGSIVVLSLVFASLTILLVALGYPMSLLCVLGGYLYGKTLGAPLGILVSTIVTSVATTVRKMPWFHRSLSAVSSRLSRQQATGIRDSWLFTHSNSSPPCRPWLLS
jgi:uncharacterized membrane protein YdjX (TVP38/TMEM64 family)